MNAIRAFDHPDYCGVSWGKDSTVLADLVQRVRPETRLVYVRCRPINNPDCELVRDAFLAKWPRARYEEIESPCLAGELAQDATGKTIQVGESGPWTRGLRLLSEIGPRHLTGVRAEESRGRKFRCQRWGENSPQASAPLAWWTGDDVFAYLRREGLPVHPAYACSFGGLIPRHRLRVDLIGCEIGQEFGRAEWEARYYPDVCEALADAARAAAAPGAPHPTPAAA
jgi:phosphoadenosine phosphosulfate reductase